MAQQSAVEWIINELRQLAFNEKTHLGMGDVRVTQGLIDELEEQALQMEKEQHQKTFKQSRQAKIFEDGMPPVWESFEQYYNEAFGNNK